MHAISCQGLTRDFGDKTAVQDLDLTVSEGEVFGFLGPNGAGKTTTVRLLNGLLAPSRGQASVLGLDVHRDAQSIRNFSGVLTESPGLYKALTLSENLRFYGALYRVPPHLLENRITSLLEDFGLSDRSQDRVGTLSKGLHQRMAILRAMIHDPQILFLDEPTAGLDPAAARQVTELVTHLSQERGRTVFLCTHNLTIAQKLCDRIGVINCGLLQAVGTPDELARQLWNQYQVDVIVENPGTPPLIGLLDESFIAGIVSHDDHTTVTLSDENLVPNLVQWLVEHRFRVHAINPHQHSLEDIYFSIQDADQDGVCEQ